MTVEFAPVPAFDPEASAAVRSRRAALPVGLLGILGPTLDRLAGIRGAAELPAHPEFRMAVFAADHGVANDEISARPADATACPPAAPPDNPAGPHRRAHPTGQRSASAGSSRPRRPR